MMAPSVLVVEDEVIIRKDLIYILRGFGCEVVGETAYGEEVLDLVEKLLPDLVFLDIRLKGDVDGIEAARRIGATHATPIIFMSAYDRGHWAVDEVVANVRAFLTKPIRRAELRAAVDKALL